MAGIIDDFSVGVAEGLSPRRTEEDIPSPLPTEREITDLDVDALPSVDEIRVAFTVVTPLITLPPAPPLVSRILHPLYPFNMRW